jgi:hypothetical protein
MAFSFTVIERENHTSCQEIDLPLGKRKLSCVALEGYKRRLKLRSAGGYSKSRRLRGLLKPWNFLGDQGDFA